MSESTTGSARPSAEPETGQTAATHRGREVLCRPIGFFFEEFERQGRPVELLRRGIDLPRQRLTDPKARVDWETFRRLMANVGEVWDEQELIAAGKRMVLSRWVQPFSAIGRLLFSCEELYHWTLAPGAGVARQHFTCIAHEIESRGRGQMAIEAKMLPGYAPSPELFRMIQGTLTAMPRLLGLPQAAVSRQATRTGARYLVSFPLHAGLLTRLRRALHWPASVRTAAKELQRAERELFERADPAGWEERVQERADSAIRESESRFYKGFHASPLLMVISSLDGRFIDANESFARTSGYRREEVLGRPIADFNFWKDRQVRDRILAELREGRTPTNVEVEFVNRAGEIRVGLLSAEIISVGGEDCIYWQSIDISDRKRAEEALRLSEERYRGLFEDSQDTIFVLSPDGTPQDINPAGLKLYGFDSKEEFLRADIARALYQDPSDRETLLGRLRERGSVRDYELALRTRTGRPLTALVTATAIRDETGRILGYRGILRDVTEQRKLEAELRSSQKMEAVGRLAGGVAHDFNNLLTAIMGYAELAIARLPPKDPLQGDLLEILKAGERAAALTRQLLAFGRQQVLEPRVLDLNSVIRDIEKLLRRTIGEHIELETTLAPDLGRVKADRGQIEQVVMNLAVNARDAMPEGGRLTFVTANVELDRALARHESAPRSGRYVLLTVGDTGRGMDDETRSRVFEPFFTTKEHGKGTGLGLSTVYGIISQSGGHVSLESERGRGATFRIYLPRVDQATAEETSRPLEAEPRTGSETILLVEDDRTIRRLTERYLRERGYRLLSAGQGREALRLIRASETPVDLVVTDMVMPAMTGPELACEIARVSPATKVLLVSGYRQAQGSAAEAGSMPFLSKPYTPQRLSRKIREVLDLRAQANGEGGEEDAPAADAAGA